MQMMLAMAESKGRKEGSNAVTMSPKHVLVMTNLSRNFRHYLKKKTPIEGILDVEIEGDDLCFDRLDVPVVKRTLPGLIPH